MENRTLINFSCDEANAIAEDLRNEYPEDYADYSDYDLFLESWEVMREYFEDDILNFKTINLPGYCVMVTDGRGHDFISANNLGDLMREIVDQNPYDEYFYFSIQDNILTYSGAGHDGCHSLEIYAMDKDFDEEIYSFLDWKADKDKKQFENREKYREKHTADILIPICEYFGMERNV